MQDCTCGRAKVEKLGLTAEQINNPQSACGSVSIASRITVPLVLSCGGSIPHRYISSSDVCE